MSDTAVIAEFNLGKVSDEWDDLCAAGLEIASQQDRNRFALGRLAQRVQTRYGENTINDYAIQIGVRKKTLYEYRNVVTFYGEHSALAENVRYSTARDAMRLGDLELALEFLEQAANEGWTVEQAGLELAKVLPDNGKHKKLFTADVQAIEADEQGVKFNFPPDATRKLRAGEKYRVVVYQKPKAEHNEQ